MNNLASYFNDVKTVGIAGHVNPDGDCVGSTMGLYLYMKEYYPQIHTDLYLESVRPEFSFLKDLEDRKREYSSCEPYDLFITVDVSTPDRIGVAGEAFAKAKKTFCIDHHVSNRGFADENHIVAHASSACEVVFDLLEEEKITREMAEALYLGIVHDTGVFQYSSTSSHTMQIAGKLMDKGINFTRIIEETFYQKTFPQQQILAKTLSDSKLYLGGKVIAAYLTSETMAQHGVTKADLDGVVSQMRLTKDVEVAIFLYQTGEELYKVSLRSKSYADVNKVANVFGGGGHVRAAGCTVSGKPEEIIQNLNREIEQQL